MTNIMRLIKSPPVKAKRTMDDGFILLFRGIQEQPWYKNSDHKSVFIHLLIKAAYKPVKVSFHGCQISLLPGQLASSYEQLSRDLGLTKALIQRAIKKFKGLGQISTLNFKKYTVITISAWSDFQQKNDTVSDTVSDTLKPTNIAALNTSTDTAFDTACDTQNNNTISKDIVKRSCPEQSTEPEIELTNIFLPLNRKDTFHYVSVSDYNEYQELYPSVDITRQFKMMYVWLRDNPKRKKTKNGVRSFITRWLSKEQDNFKGSYSTAENNELTDISWAHGMEIES